MKQKWNAIVLAAVMVCVAAAGLLFVTGCKKQPEQNRYALEAAFDPDTMTVTGELELTYHNTSDVPLSELCFHLYGNTYRENAAHPPVSAANESVAYPNGKRVFGKTEVSKTTADGQEVAFSQSGEDEEFLTVPLKKECAPGETAKVGISFSVTLAEIHHRLGYGDDTVNLGNWYPILCAVGKDGFLTDPYDYKGDPFCSETADYTVEFRAPSDYVCAFGGEVTEQTESEGTVTYRVRSEQVRDFAAVLSKEFSVETATTKDGAVTVSYYHLGDEQAAERLQLALSAVETFGELYGAYPYSTYAVAEADFCHGGMEYPRLVYVSDRLEGEDTDLTIVHETAHQWWYGVVGNDQVREAYLDEGLAEFSTALYFDRHPTETLSYASLVREAEQSYRLFERIVGESTGSFDSSMNRALSDYRSEYEYVVVTYRRGMLLFDSLRTAMGEKELVKGLRRYYDRNCYRVATGNDLIGALSVKTDVSGLVLSFVEGRAMK